MTIIKLDFYPGIDFIPFHEIKKLNSGNEPYLKSIIIRLGLEFFFFKVNGEIYILKPTEKNDLTKKLCAKVSNPLTLRSAEGSITGNCAKGVKKEYIDYVGTLLRLSLSDEELFRRITLNIDKLK